MATYKATNGHELGDGELSSAASFFIMRWVAEMLTIHDGEPLGFPHNAARYRCCCQNCHVKFGTAIVAAFEAVCASFQLINAFYFISVTDDEWRGFAGLITVVITLIAIALLCQGCRKEKAWLLLPHLVFQVVGFLITVGLLLYVIFETDHGVHSVFNVTYDERKSVEERNRLDSIKGVLVFGLSLGIGYQVFAFYIVLKCYHYFHDKNFFMIAATT